jgi:predicted TIM-barrel fold metal-dependent hydrolase
MTDSNDYRLISADAHVLEPPDLFERLPAQLRSRAPKLAQLDDGDAWVVDGSAPVPLPATAASGSGYQRFNLRRQKEKRLGFADVLPGLYDPTERLRAQDADSVQAEVLYPSARLWESITALDDRELKLACARAYNDWIARFSAHSPDRLIGLAKIPSTTCEDARDELLRCVKELSLRGAILDAWPSGNAVAGNAADDPFWEAVNELRVPVSLHHAIGGAKSTLPPSGIAPGLKPPMADAALPLVASGVFDRFPNVKLVLTHGNAGWAFHWLEFMDINYVRHRHLDEYALPDPDAIPSEYIRKYSWFVFHQDRSSVKNRNKLGTAHLMWGSHFPYEDANWPDDREQAMRVTDEVPTEDRQALLADNVARLYRLTGHEKGFADGEIERFEQLVHF